MRRLCQECQKNPVTKRSKTKFRSRCWGCYQNRKSIPMADRDYPAVSTHSAPKPSRDERFWAKVVRASNDACWEWQGELSPKGYGRFRYDGERAAHRVAWLITHGESCPECVLHTCDNRKCVNPSHLYAGTNDQNIRDAIERGHIIQGVRQKTLSVKEVQMTRLMHRLQWPKRFIAKQFGVSPQVIQWCIDGRAFRDIPDYNPEI